MRAALAAARSAESDALLRKGNLRARDRSTPFWRLLRGWGCSFWLSHSVVGIQLLNERIVVHYGVPWQVSKGVLHLNAAALVDAHMPTGMAGPGPGSGFSLKHLPRLVASASQ